MNEWDQINKVLAKLDKIERVREQRWRKMEFSAMAEGLSDGEESEELTEREAWDARLTPMQQRMNERRGSITELMKHGTNHSQIARVLRISRGTVEKDIKRYHLARR